MLYPLSYEGRTPSLLGEIFGTQSQLSQLLM
jgi:hypothetical protein